MKNNKWPLFLVALALMAGAAGALARLKSHPQIGKPGLKAMPIPGSLMMKLDLPERVLDCSSTNVPEPDVVLGYLPPDTSYAERHYQAPDGFDMSGTLILMGTDRTSIHKPQFCLEGQGWRIDGAVSGKATVPVYQPHQYDLPVMKLIATKQGVVNGETITMRGVYVYWFVAEDRLTGEHWQRMWWMAEKLLRTGELQRWAYVSCFAVCEPGREDATFERMKQLLAGAVPQFQLTTGAAADDH